MRRTLGLALGFGIVAAVLYAVLPLYTAWTIRHAIRTNDPAHLETAVEWPSVKETLRPSLKEIALGPAPTSPGDVGLWTRLKTFAGQRAVDQLVESYATPEGLPKLFAYGKFYRERVKGQIDETAKLPIFQRATRFWRRVKRARFTSPTRVEFEIADKFTPRRHYDGVLELRGWAWKLTELRVRMRDVEPSEEDAEALGSAESEDDPGEVDDRGEQPALNEAKP